MLSHTIRCSNTASMTFNSSFKFRVYWLYVLHITQAIARLAIKASKVGLNIYLATRGSLKNIIINFLST